MASWPIRLIVLYALTLAFVRAFFHAHMVDIEIDDEAGYLWAGLHFFHTGAPTAENSPLYALWYWLESCFISDPIILYQANYGILLLAILVMLVVSLRLAGVSIAGIGLVLSWASIAYYFDVWPNVTMLAAALALLAAILSLRVESPARAYAATATVLAVAVFVRPEFLLSFLILLVVASYFAYHKREYSALLFPVLVFGALWLVFGAPFGGGRLWVAFGQHYAANVIYSQGLPIDPWNNWQQIVKADFGEVSTPLQAFLSNPNYFMKHLEYNAMQLSYIPSMMSPSPSFVYIGTSVRLNWVLTTLSPVLVRVAE